MYTVTDEKGSESGVIGKSPEQEITELETRGLYLATAIRPKEVSYNAFLRLCGDSSYAVREGEDGLLMIYKPRKHTTKGAVL